MPSTNLSRRDFILNAHLRGAWARAVLERLDPYTSVVREQRVFEIILSCDSTREGRHLSWLSAWRRRQWKELGLRHVSSSWELGELIAALSHFDRVRCRLPPERRDIGQYHTPSELLRAEAALSDVDRRAVREAERRVAMEESTMLHDDSRWKLVRLDGRNAAIWWGRGTKWCTAALSGNQFSSYSKLGDLLVLVAPSGRYQLAKGTGEFRDASDAHANLDIALRGAPMEVKRLMDR